MKLIEAQTKIEQLAFIPFKEYLSPTQVEDAMMIINKGRTGQLLELTIGLNLSNTTLDFEDGELKTNKCDRFGKPLETMFITQTASIIDELLSKKGVPKAQATAVCSDQQRWQSRRLDVFISNPSRFITAEVRSSCSAT